MINIPYSIENETAALKESVAKLEAEKKANNFGKTEKEKMKVELEKATENVQKLKSSLDSITREKDGLSKKIKEMSEGHSDTNSKILVMNSTRLQSGNLIFFP